MTSDDSFTGTVFTGNLAAPCAYLAATTITDISNNIEYGIFAGGEDGSNYIDAINAISITNGSFDTVITSKLSEARRTLTASTITDVVTGIQFAVFAGGYNGKDYSKAIDIVCMVNGQICQFVGNMLNKHSQHGGTTITDSVTGIQYAIVGGGKSASSTILS